MITQWLVKIHPSSSLKVAEFLVGDALIQLRSTDFRTLTFNRFHPCLAVRLRSLLSLTLDHNYLSQGRLPVLSGPKGRIFIILCTVHRCESTLSPFSPGWPLLRQRISPWGQRRVKWRISSVNVVTFGRISRSLREDEMLWDIVPRPLVLSAHPGRLAPTLPPMSMGKYHHEFWIHASREPLLYRWSVIQSIGYKINLKILYYMEVKWYNRS